MQFGGNFKPPLGVVFDSAMGGTIDDPLALALLFGLQGKNESRVVAVTTSRSSLASAEFCDILVRFYTGEPGPFAPPMPIGMNTRGKDAPSTPMLAAVNAKPYPRTIHKLNDTADPVADIRNALSAQFDQNAVVVLTGPAVNLAGVLALPEGKDLIARKVRHLVIAGAPDAALAAAWPTPIFVVPKDVGEMLPFPASALEKEFAWAPAHPIVDAWRAVQPQPKDAPSCALAAALYAVRTSEVYFKVSDGKPRTLGFDPAQKERILQAYVELASTKAVPRRGRRGG